MNNVEKALALREKRLAEEKQQREKRVQLALDNYKSRKMNEWRDQINTELTSVGELALPSWGEATKSEIESATSKLDALNSIRNSIDTHKDYFDDKSYEQYSNAINALLDSYSNYKSLAEYQAQWNSQEDYDAWYEENKELIELQVQASQDADFDKYVESGKGVSNPNWYESFAPIDWGGWKPFGDGKSIANMVTFAEQNRSKAAEASARVMQYGGELNETERIVDLINSQMENDEKNLYHYYVGKGEQDKANRYLSLMNEVLTQRYGGQIANSIKGNRMAELVFALGAGVENFASGIKNLDNYILGTEADPYTAAQYAAPTVREDMEGAWGVAYDLVQTTGNMLPSIAVSVATGVPLLGNIAMGLSSAGNAYAEMRNAGYNEWQARLYGASIGASEAALQQVIGGISPLKGASGGMLGKVAETALKKINNGFLRFAVKLGFEAVDEGFEEGLQSILEPIFKGLFTWEWDDFNIDWAEVGYSAALGALSSGQFNVASGVGTLIKSHNTETSLGGTSLKSAWQTFKKTGKLSDLMTAINEGKKSVTDSAAYYADEALEINADNTHAQWVKSRIDSGKNVSGYQINRLIEANENTLREQDKNAIKNAISERLKVLGELGDISALTDALTKQAIGEKLSLKEKNLIKNSKYGQRVANELDPDNIKSGEYSSSWAEEIDTQRINPKEYSKLAENAEAPSTEAVPSTQEAKAVSVTENTPASATATESKIEATEDGEVTLEEASKKYGAQAQAMVHTYKEGQDVGQYANAYALAFDMGKDGVRFTYAMNNKALSYLTAEQREVAYQAGADSKTINENAKNTLQNESENATIDTTKEVGNNEQEGLHLRDSSERNGSANTRGQISTVEESTRGTERKSTDRGPKDRKTASLAYERRVSAKELGIKGGLATRKVDIIAEGSETPAMTAARKRAEARGKKVTFFSGGFLYVEQNDVIVEARAFIEGDNVYIRVDHPYYNADQLIRHELGHDMIARGEVDVAEVQKRMVKLFGEENFDKISQAYTDAYNGSGLTAEEIWEEVICDSLGDMNVFANRDDIGKMNNKFLSMLKSEVKESSVSERGPPSTEGKASRETAKRTPKITKYIPVSKIGQSNYDNIGKQLRNIYGNYNNVIANTIPIAIGNTVYIVDSSKQGGHLEYGVRKVLVIEDSVLRNKFIEEKNDVAISKSYVSEELLGRFRNKHGDSVGSGVGRVQGENLSSTQGKSQDNQIRVLGDNGLGGVGGLNDTTKYSSPEEAKISGKVSDAKFSIEFADDIADKQRKFVEDGLSRISAEELEKAIEDTSRMVEEMKPYAKILPQDKVGKTLVKNGSYDISVENTTVCIRTLAYNSFVDMVSEKVGRPLTQMESFLVSQKLYEIAKEPQCLYCYVSLGRKAYNEMVIRYTEQRDEAISKYEAAGKPNIPSTFDENWSLFKEFLDGRKPTKNMWDRYVGWLKAYNSGEQLVTLEDISTEAKRLALVESDGVLASQVKDILKYAQSASWAKKQTQYVAYNDEILKLKPNVIRNLNSHYGMRWYSFSDYSGAFIVENMQQITDAAIRGLKGLSYTKDTDFAEIFAPTGMNINISVYAKKTETGYEIDAKQSADIEKAIALRAQYPNVGIVVVATDKGGVDWALAQEWSDVVIPFHTVRTGADVAEFYNWEIFNSEQNDTVTDQNLWDAYVNDIGKKKASKMVYPSEHQNNRETYLSICEKRGHTPRFKSFIDNPNYMKLVNETRQSESQTKPLKASFDIDAALRSFDKFVEKGGYYEGWYNDGIDVDGEADIVAEDVRAGRKANEVDYGRQDINFDDVAKSRKVNRTHGKASMELELDTVKVDMERSNGVTYEGKPFWAAMVNRRTGDIVATWTYPEAEAEGFDLNKYEDVTEKDGYVFFTTDLLQENNRIEYDDYGERLPDRLIKRINEQIVVNSTQEAPLTERIRDLHEKIGTLNKRISNVTQWVKGSRELLEKRANNEITFEEYSNRLREDNYYKNLDDERNSLEEQMNALVRQLEKEEGKPWKALRSEVLYGVRKQNFSRELDAIDFMNSEEGKKITNRSLLVNALESVAQNDIEKKKLEEYKSNIEALNAEEAKLAEIRGKLFEKNSRLSSEERKALQLEMTKTSNRVNVLDSKLLNLEATKALKGVVERERRKAFKSGMERQRQYVERVKADSEKTALRNKVRKLIKNLNSLFKENSKKNNIKDEMKGTVASSLALANVLFSNDIRNEDIVRLGVDSVTEAESKLLNQYRDLLDERESVTEKIESIYGNANISEEGYAEVARLQKEVERLNSQMSALSSKLSDVFQRERARLNKTAIDILVNDLINEYSKLNNSPNSYIKNAYSDTVKARLEAFRDSIGGTIARDMTAYQLQEFYDTFVMIEHMIKTSNKLFVEGKKEDLMATVTSVQDEIFKATKEPKDRGKMLDKVVSAINSFSWNNLRPVDAFERLGSSTLERLFWNFIDGMGVAARDYDEAKIFIENARKKHGYDKWDLKETNGTFMTRDGLRFKPSLADKMSIYAYSQREQALPHMVDGGFVYETKSEYKDNDKKNGHGKTLVRRKLSSTYRLDEKTIQTIIGSMTKEQRAYVDAILPYLTDMGKKGNEVSRVLYGIDLFGEKIYFPLQSSRDYRSSTETALNATPTMSTLVNSGFTKQTTPGADNPIVLKPFDDVVAEHIEKMSNYHGLVLPIETLRRVFDNVSRDGDRNSLSTKAVIGARFGVEAQSYFEQLLTDFNGGIMPSGAKNPVANFFGKSKAMAVAANLSVVAQQYFSIIRATEFIKPVYFAPFMNSEAKKAAPDMKQYEEMREYAPIAIIKELGGFDVSSGGRLKNDLKYVSARKDKGYYYDQIGEKAMWLAGKMDELGWSTIWKAVKAEVATEQNLTPGTEEFFAACGKRFTEVVTKTQVYDSVASRSAYMRSKNDAVKYATSFLGEPTVVVGRMFVATNNFVKAVANKDTATIQKAATHLLRAGAVLAVTTLLTDLAKSLVYGARDDEEGKALFERWSKNFAEAIWDDLNPLNYLPWGRDIWSIVEGWDVDRPDMALFADLVTSVKKMFKGEDEELKAEDWIRLIGSAGNIFGIPLKNIMRDAEAIKRVIGDITDNIAPTDIPGAFAEGFTGTGNKHKSLYDALVRGEQSKLDEIKETYKNDSAYQSAVRKALRDYDPRIKQAAEAVLSGNASEYERILNEILNEGHFEKADIRSAIGSEVDAIQKKNKPEETETETEDKVIGTYSTEMIFIALANGNTNSISAMKEDIISTGVANGQTRKEAESSFKSSFSSEVKERYYKGELSPAESKLYLTRYGDFTDEQATTKLQYWDYVNEHPKVNVESSWFDTYNEKIEGYTTSIAKSGISIDVYVTYRNKIKDIEGDKDKNGNTISGSKRKKILNVINSLPITKSQKDALYYAQGYTKSNIGNAPWH